MLEIVEQGPAIDSQQFFELNSRAFEIVRRVTDRASTQGCHGGHWFFKASSLSDLGSPIWGKRMLAERNRQAAK